jgi:HEPN domain-containing protein
MPKRRKYFKNKWEKLIMTNLVINPKSIKFQKELEGEYLNSRIYLHRRSSLDTLAYNKDAKEHIKILREVNNFLLYYKNRNLLRTCWMNVPSNPR